MLDYGIIGNCNTAALISKNACIEWMCYPAFADESIFAKIIDKKKGGALEIIPDKKCKSSQHYIKDTNILETVFECREYAFRVTDFFPRYKQILPLHPKNKFAKNMLVRIIKKIRGKPRIKIIFDPKLDYARGKTVISTRNGNIEAKNKGKKIVLRSDIARRDITERNFFRLNSEKFVTIGNGEDKEYSLSACNSMKKHTGTYWKNWVKTLVMPKTNRDEIVRSALAIKLLTYGRTGAIVAAPTTSIPEEIGSHRCFDYRFCWVRDAAYAVDALKKIGRNYEAKRFMEFMTSIITGLKEKNRGLHALYGINGEKKLTEKKLLHLDGFENSKPVRIGNAAYAQEQHDIYGELINMLYIYFVYYEYEKLMKKRHWEMLFYLINQIKMNWRKQDSGIWEFRGKKEHFTFSKFMCYVGLDRAIRIAEHFRNKKLACELEPLRNEIMSDILKKGYNPSASAFTISYGSDSLDASLLRMAYHEFLPPSDSRLRNTIKEIFKTLRKKEFVQRYSVRDDFGKPKNAFTLCSFWLIDALYYMGEKKLARKLYLRIMRRSNHLGLFSEDIDMRTKKLSGNFPQGYVHLAAINTSILLSEWEAKRKKIKVRLFPKSKNAF